MAEQKSEQSTEERILEAAMDIFCRDGIQGARMQDIADLANINRAMLHYYFRDKESLSNKAIEARTKKFSQSVHQKIDADVPFDEKLDGYIQAQIKVYSENPDLIIFGLHRSMQDHDFLRRNFQHSFDGSIFLDQLETEVKEGRIKPFTKKEFAVFVSSLCAFPFIASCIYKMIFGWEDEQWKPFLEQYKEHLPELIKQAIYTDYK